MDLGTRFDRAYKKLKMIRAIQKFDVKELSSLIADGADAKVLIRDKKLVWHFQCNLLPEADKLKSYGREDRKQLKEISRRLTQGNNIVKLLIKAGVFSEEYSQYSLCELEEKREPVSENVLCSGLWQAVSPEALKLILADGADINSTNSSGLTFLHHIALAPDGKYFRPLEMVKILIEAGADINAQTRDKVTPLMKALDGLRESRNCADNVKITAFMVKHGAKVSYHNDDKTHEAYEAVYSFIEEIEEYPRMSDAEFDLMTAVYSNDFPAVKEILSANPELNINFQTVSGYTPLMFAMQNEDTKILKYLLSHGADPNIRNNRGFTSLIQNTDNEKIELLLNNGADPNVTDCMNCTLLNALCKCSLGDEKVKTVKILLSHGADPNIQDTYDRSLPLMNCVRDGDFSENTVQAVKYLLEAGAEVNARDDSGNTALMYAAKSGGEHQISVIKILLDNGADPSMRNNEGDSALDIILDSDTGIEASNHEAVKLLIRQGLYLNDKETHFSGIFDDSRYTWALMFSFLKRGDTFAELIRNNTVDELIGAVGSGLDMSVEDKNGKTFPEAAVEARNLELLKACLKTGENNSEYTPEDMFYTLLTIYMNKYDVDGVKLLLQCGINACNVKTFVWHFAVNYVPEASESEDAKKFKDILDRGTKILHLLHEVEPSIPICDTDGRELTYTYAERSGYKDWASELLPLKDDAISRVRHAVTCEALSEILSACPDVDLNTDITLEDTASAKGDKYDENESFEDITRKI
ncbi:MAG: ankyrin repeat domain-containing protein, partial [Synergistaceae bacterium]|nr:ankyrin repeat domain-containing protein [Synergistaceae bacterium]